MCRSSRRCLLLRHRRDPSGCRESDFQIIIVLVSASVSFSAATASLIFLIVLHKGEYFLSARILGHQINARAWEMLFAMLVMEAAFGIPGIAVAPVLMPT